MHKWCIIKFVSRYRSCTVVIQLYNKVFLPALICYLSIIVQMFYILYTGCINILRCDNVLENSPKALDNSPKTLDNSPKTLEKSSKTLNCSPKTIESSRI